jgi:hypothetical protein
MTRTLTTDRAAHRRMRERRKAAGQCIACGKPHKGSVRCPACKAKKALYDNKYIARMRVIWKKLGICLECGKNNAVKGKTRCGMCLEADDDRYALKVARQKRLAEASAQSAA